MIWSVTFERVSDKQRLSVPIESDEEHIDFMVNEGNLSCDCNRADFFGDECDCGESQYKLISIGNPGWSLNW